MGVLVLVPAPDEFGMWEWKPPKTCVLFSSCPQSFPASGSFPVGWLFASSEQGIRALASLLPMNIQDWSPLGLTGWISLQSKGLSRVFSSTTVQKHRCFGAQLSLWSNSHIHIWPLEKTIALTRRTSVGKVIYLLFNMHWFKEQCRKKHLSFAPPWEPRTPFSFSRVPDSLSTF